MLCREKRRKKHKPYVLLDFDDNTYEVLDTNRIKLAIDEQLFIGKTVLIDWQDKGQIPSKIFGFSSSRSKLLSAKIDGAQFYTSDEEVAEDNGPINTTNWKKAVQADDGNAANKKKVAKNKRRRDSDSTFEYASPPKDYENLDDATRLTDSSLIASLSRCMQGQMEGNAGILSRIDTLQHQPTSPISQNLGTMSNPVLLELGSLKDQLQENNQHLASIVRILDLLKTNQDKMVELLTKISANGRNTSTSEPIPVVPPLLINSTSEVAEVDDNTNDLGNLPMHLSMRRINDMKLVARSRSNFAKMLTYEIFTSEDRKNASITGANGKRTLDEQKMEWIKRVTFIKYPLQANEGGELVQWRYCKAIIDASLRQTRKSNGASTNIA